MYYQTDYVSPVGKIMMASDGVHLNGLWIEGQMYYGSTIKEEMQPKDSLPVFKKTKDWLERYFSGGRPEISEIPLAPSGSDFRQKVWAMLCEIPYGEVTTYGRIAEKIAELQNKKSMSAQAVGGAVGHNPISIIIPCHRVVGTDGSMTGYAGGIDKKEWLLAHEGYLIKRLTITERDRLC
ncbi:MAG: methylated-DNA--[protein]-cysteine S-methyltransferase [Schaedlerella sp.]|nr:methylated-DNA--[protein]-cysteine S-methyltransferase [Lachnospiraceae bacterium]MDY4201677.1 methylated-DNA--[protein]-cysteine S-methyltransferase [Schaedlerella sp.]